MFGLTKKSLGQHFLLDENITNKIVEAIDKDVQNILEVGPGIGALTKLLPRDKNVILVEKDSRCIAFLRSKEYDKYFKILEEDVLEIEPPFMKMRYSLVGNLPYNIASRIFIRFMYE